MEEIGTYFDIQLTQNVQYFRLLLVLLRVFHHCEVHLQGNHYQALVVEATTTSKMGANKEARHAAESTTSSFSSSKIAMQYNQQNANPFKSRQLQNSGVQKEKAI